MDDDEILRTQRTLRRRLFEGSTAIQWRPARELAAQLLLYLDDPQACWRLTTDWLRDALDADRVDGGFGGFVSIAGECRSYVVLAESKRGSMGMPSVLGATFDASNPSIRAVWRDPGVAAISDVSQERSFTADMRGTLQALGTSAKLALPVRDGSRPVGLICADWHRPAPRWDAEACNQLAMLGQCTLGPVLAAATRLARRDQAAAPSETASNSSYDRRCLTPAELKVARLVASGLSYKEVARQLDRSVSTIDHQLRSIREKLGVRSTGRLTHLLNERAEELLR